MKITRPWPPRGPVGATLALLLVAALTGCIASPTDVPAAVRPSAAHPSSTCQNPLGGGGFADPMALRVDGHCYVYGTGDRFPLRRSTDLVHWTSAGTAMSSTPSWSSGNSWAPSVLAVKRRCPDAPASSRSTSCYVMYYVGLDNALAPPANCIGVATAGSPAGPFRDHGILTTANGAVDPVRGPVGCGDARGYSNIDPAAFIDPVSGRSYLYLSTGHEASGAWRRTVSVIALAEDLIHAATDRVALFGVTQAWEGDVVEGPWMTRDANGYYLFYCGGRFTDRSYALGASPAGPFTNRRPIRC